MSEKYVKDILEKLDEIEKLHAKLRSLVPRVKNNELESGLNNILERSKSIIDKQNEDTAESIKRNLSDVRDDSESSRNFFKNSKSGIKHFFTPPTHSSSILSTKHFKRLRSRPIGDKWRKVRRNSIDFLTKQWHEKNSKIKDMLSSIIERDIILVTRAAQTSDTERPDEISKKQSVTGHPVADFSEVKYQFPARRRSTMQDALERLLEHFNYSRESGLVNKKRVDVHDHGLGDTEPHRVQKPLLIPDEEAETLNIVSSAARLSVDDNRKGSLTGNLISKLDKKYRTSDLT